MSNIRKDILWRMLLVLGGSIAFGGLLIFSVGDLQFSEKDYWLNKADSLTLKYMEIDARRGNVYASNGELLASSIPFYKLHFDATVMNRDSFINYQNLFSTSFSKILGNRSTLAYKIFFKNAFRTRARYGLLMRKASYLQVKKIKKLPVFKQGTYKSGLIIEEFTTREKPFGMLASRTIGFYRSQVGGAGIERTFNTELKGLNGKKLYQKIAGGYRPINAENVVDPQEGYDLHTHLDIQMQDIVENALYKGLEKHQAHHGTAIVLDVKTGHIKAIANLTKANDAYAERFNYAIGEGYEPGSTFKIMSMMALIEDGYVDLDDSIDTELGETNFYGRKMLDSEKGEHSLMSFKEVIEKSSNVGTSKLINRYYKKQPRKFLTHIKNAQLMNKTGVQIKGEASPTFYSPDNATWSLTTLPWMSIGYELKLTSLQLLAFVNAIANKGNWVKPTLISHLSSFGKIVKKYPVQKPQRICSKATAEKINQVLKGVVENGTGRGLNDLSFSCAGKTGTALIAPYSQKKYNASFVGYFPADEPRYSCIVVVNKPSMGQFYGASVALPIFKEIAQKTNSLHLYNPWSKDTTYVPHLYAFSEDLKKIADELDLSMGKTMHGKIYRFGAEKLSIDSSFEKLLVPNFYNLGLATSSHIAHKLGLKVQATGRGKVVAQLPHVGSEINSGSTLKLVLKQR